MKVASQTPLEVDLTAWPRLKQRCHAVATTPCTPSPCWPSGDQHMQSKFFCKPTSRLTGQKVHVVSPLRPAGTLISRSPVPSEIICGWMMVCPRTLTSTAHSKAVLRRAIFDESRAWSVVVTGSRVSLRVSQTELRLDGHPIPASFRFVGCVIMR